MVAVDHRFALSRPALLSAPDKKSWLIPGSGVMKTDAAATKKGAASK